MPRAERAPAEVAYERRRPERTALYEVVRDNLETLYGAIDDCALDVRLPKHAKKELELRVRRRLREEGLSPAQLLQDQAARQEAFAIDPTRDRIAGDPAYRDFGSLPEKVEAAVLEALREDTAAWVKKAADAGIERVWIHANRDTPEAIAAAKDRGLSVLTGACAVMYLDRGLSYRKRGGGTLVASRQSKESGSMSTAMVPSA